MEFEALRAEMASLETSMRTVFGTALTVLAAITGFALAKDEGRLEMLLALPLVLTGLTIPLVDGALAIYRMSDYLRNHVTRRLVDTSEAFPSWEHYQDDFRRDTTLRLAASRASGAVAVLLVFVVPSIAALGVTADEATGELWPLWWAGMLSLAVLAFFGHRLWSASRTSDARGTRRAGPPDEQG